MNNSTNEKLFDLEKVSIPELSDVSEGLFSEKDIVQTEGKKYVVFLINEKHFAIASDKIAEVVRPLPFTPLPTLPDWLLGIANLRGDIISIIDLHYILKSQASDAPASKLIVLRSNTSDSHIAFKVDKVQEIITVPGKEVQPQKSRDSSFTEGILKHKSDKIMLLKVEEILSSLQLN